MRRGGRVVSSVRARQVLVELDAAPACARCARGEGCGAALFAPTSRPLRLVCEWSLPARPAPGTPVTVELAEHGTGWLRPVFLAYGLPTVGLLVGACFPEPWSPLTALLGCCGGILAWRAGFARSELPPSASGLATLDPSPDHPGTSGETR